MDFPMRINVVSKRGMGLVIIIVIVLLSGLAIIGLANYKFVERTTLDVGVSVTGDKALFYAQSAVEEAIHIASLQVNDPSSDLFKTIRSQAQTGPFEINYPVPNLAAELGSAAGFKYSLEGGSVKSKVMFQNSFEKMIYEKFLTLKGKKGKFFIFFKTIGSIVKTTKIIKCWTLIKIENPIKDSNTILITNRKKNHTEKKAH